MKKFIFCCLAFFSVSNTRAQTYNSPESVEKNTPDGNYFVSNNGAGEIIKLLPNGSLQNFASGMTTGPHGLELLGDTLYACDGNNIRLFDRSTGTLINTVDLGATFLNGITHRGNDLFITDFTAKKIYRMNTKTNAFNVFATVTKTPNGIIYDDINDRLVYVCWGSSAPVYALSPADSSVTLLTTTPVSNIDGIAMNCQGDFYISSWTPGSIRMYNAAFTTASVVTTSGLSSPADIYFDATKDTVYVPNSGSANNVVKVKVSSCLTTGIAENKSAGAIQVFPNPSEGVFTLVGLRAPAQVSVTDLAGKTIWSDQVTSNMTNIEPDHISRGIYLLKVVSGGQIQIIKISRQ